MSSSRLKPRTFSLRLHHWAVMLLMEECSNGVLFALSWREKSQICYRGLQRDNERWGEQLLVLFLLLFELKQALTLLFFLLIKLLERLAGLTEPNLAGGSEWMEPNWTGDFYGLTLGIVTPPWGSLQERRLSVWPVSQEEGLSECTSRKHRFKHRIIPTCFKTPTQIVEVHIFLKVLFRNFTTNLHPTPTAPVWSVWQFQLCSHLPCVVIVRLFTAECLKTLSKKSLPPPTKAANYRVIYLFVRGFKWALVSQSSHIGEVRRSIWNGSFIAKHAIPLLDGGNKRNKNEQLCSFQAFGWACLSGCSVERSSMCFRDCPGSGSAETAGSRRQTGSSWLIKHSDSGQHSGGVWGPVFQPADKPPVPAGAGICPPHATPAISSNTPYLRRGPELIANTPNLHKSSDGLIWEHQLHQQV